MKKVIQKMIEEKMIPVFLLILVCIFILGAFTTVKGECKWLISSNEYKRELIEAYEVYYDAAERVIEDDYVTLDYYNSAKERLDSLYKSEL